MNQITQTSEIDSKSTQRSKETVPRADRYPRDVTHWFIADILACSYHGLIVFMYAAVWLTSGEEAIEMGNRVDMAFLLMLCVYGLMTNIMFLTYKPQAVKLSQYLVVLTILAIVFRNHENIFNYEGIVHDSKVQWALIDVGIRALFLTRYCLVIKKAKRYFQEKGMLS